MNHDTAPVLTTSNLSFSFYKGQPVLDNINITVPAGSIYGFLGPNGAGKTTTMRLLTGLLPQQGDHIQFFNQSLSTQLPNLFHRVGCLIETPSLYLHLSGLDNLRLVARMKDIDEKKAEPVLATVGLQKAAHRKAGQYSLGMKQRLAIAIALLNDPQLLMLDEPVNGLDPNGMVEMRELMKELNREKGITIFISSHLLHEVEKMCTHIGIIHKGKIRFEGKISELSHANGSGPQIILTVSNAEKWLPILTEHYSDGQVITSDKI
ncbi:MAG: ABC transporter ATP-binding protein, partial [Sediminibacterium sp.]